ncbi:MAG: hypothetical protein JNM17_11500 [Archangium sp.]|nr:hypothetical protein [Archangium sp.]
MLVRTVSSLRAASPPEVLERVTRECAISTLPATFGSGEAELVALACELKPLVRQELTDDALEATRQRGLPGGVALTLGARAGTRTRVYLSRDEARAREAIAAEARGDDERLGLLLGYPPCCVNAFDSMPKFWVPALRVGRRRTNLELARAAAKRSSTFHARLNSVDLHLFHYVAWTPCSYDCAPSLKYADAVAAELAKRPRGWLGPRERGGAEDFVARADALLAARRALWKDAHVSFTVNARNEVLDAWPTSRDHPRRIVSRDQLEREIALAAFLLSTSRTSDFLVFPFTAAARPTTP